MSLPTSGPTDRWYPLNLLPKQRNYWNSSNRFNVVPCGRRSCKTELAKRRLMKKAFKKQLYSRTRYIFSAPIHHQAKMIFWQDAKDFVPEWLLAEDPSEGELTIKLLNGSSIQVMGLDKPQRAEGDPIDGIVIDEYADIKDTAWPNHIRPALSDRLGWADFTGVPEGRNHFFHLANFAKKDTTGEWGYHHWTSEEALPQYVGMVQGINMGLRGQKLKDYCIKMAMLEIESAKRTLDPKSYDQEYLASFVTFEGMAYYCYDPEIHASNKLEYDPKRVLIFCFDFNVDPGTAVVCQEQKHPKNPDKTETHCIGEVHIPTSSNTPMVCRKLIKDWGHHTGDIKIYGDPSGGARGSAKTEGSDWDLVKQILKSNFKGRVLDRVQKRAPKERSRINSVNARLKSTSGEVSMRIDPVKCPNLCLDFEGVTLLEGSDGEIDKKGNPKLTHLTDGLGYYIHSEFPIGGGGYVSIDHM